MSRIRVALSGHAHDIKERWFKGAAQPLQRAVNMMIGDTYPFESRNESGSSYDRNKVIEYDKARNRCQTFVYEQRNKVNDDYLPRFEIVKTSEPATNRATIEMQQLLVDGALDRLLENLIAYSEIFVAKRYVEPLQSTLQRVYEIESQRMREYLKSYRAEYREGVRPIEEEME